MQTFSHLTEGLPWQNDLLFCCQKGIIIKGTKFHWWWVLERFCPKVELTLLVRHEASCSKKARSARWGKHVLGWLIAIVDLARHGTSITRQKNTLKQIVFFNRDSIKLAGRKTSNTSSLSHSYFLVLRFGIYCQNLSDNLLPSQPIKAAYSTIRNSCTLH